MEQETESFGVKPVRRWKNIAPVVQRKDQDTPTSVREESAKESHVPFYPNIYYLNNLVHGTLEHWKFNHDFRCKL